MRNFLQVTFGIMAICIIVFVPVFVIKEDQLNGAQDAIRNLTQGTALDAAPQASTSTSTANAIITNTTIPIELTIERLGIHAPIEPVGVLDNAMAVPTKAEDVGWYENGPRPGDEGSAVLAGHVNWTGGQDAVFALLHTMKIGDTVKVLNSNGVTDTFVVTLIKDYPMDSDTAEVFSSSDGSQRLNLITCDGVWDKILKTHQSRLVVFAEKI